MGVRRDRLISIHALRVEGDIKEYFLLDISDISIHALRVEGDLHEYGQHKAMAISIHALRVEGDTSSCNTGSRRMRFLSTPSGWRATGKEIKAEKAAEFLSTPSGWRATWLLVRQHG